MCDSQIVIKCSIHLNTWLLSFWSWTNNKLTFSCRCYWLGMGRFLSTSSLSLLIWSALSPNSFICTYPHYDEALHHLFHNNEGAFQQLQQEFSKARAARPLNSHLLQGHAVSVRVPVSVDASRPQSSIAGWRRWPSTSTTSGVVLLFVVASDR